jgi:hypothetical protein
VQYWLEKKSKETLLLALTDGELQWDRAANDFIWNDNTPLPIALRGVFRSEPRWVDFRAVGTRENSKEFMNLAADLASVIHGKPKEDILSDELRQQKRNFRYALAAAVTMSVLAIAAIGLGIYSRSKQLETQRTFAASDFSRALELIDTDEHPAALAHLSRAIELNPTDYPALLTAYAALTEWWLPRPVDQILDQAEPVAFLDTDPAGTLIISGSHQSITVWDWSTGTRLFTARTDELPITSVAVSPDGQTIAVASSTSAAGAHGVVKTFEAKTGRAIGSTSLEGYVSRIRFLSFESLIASSAAGLFVIDVKSGNLLPTGFRFSELQAEEQTELVDNAITEFVILNHSNKIAIVRGLVDGDITETRSS